MKTKYILILALFFMAAITNAQTMNFNVSTYFYSWERTDSTVAGYETTHLKGYQNLLMNLSQDKWSLNTSLLTQEDIANKSGDGFDYSFYNIYIKGTNLWNALDVGIGRQYIFAGVGNTSVDGLSLKYKAGMNKQYQLSVYGGALTPGNYDFQSYPSFNNNFIFGSKFSYYGSQGFTGSLSYFLKRQKYDPYYAPRIDTMYNTSNELIVTDSKSQQLIGLNLNYTGKQKYTLYGKAFYDIYLNKFYQAEFNISYPVKNWRFSADYAYRGAQLTYNTTFWTMAQFWPLSHYQQLEAGIDYTLKNGMNLFATFSNVFYIDDNSFKYQAGFKSPAYGIYYIGYSGYSGESNGAVGYFYQQLVPDKLSGNVTLNYSNYNLGDYSSSPNENQFSAMLGLAYRPNRQFTIDAQGQLMTNRIYSVDTRFLLGVTYRLFTKF